MPLKQITQKDQLIAKMKQLHRELGRVLMEYDEISREDQSDKGPKKYVLIHPLTNKPMKGGRRDDANSRRRRGADA